MGILNIYLNCINFDKNNFDENDSDTIIHVRFLTCHIKYEKHKALKKNISGELIPVAWHPYRWWDWWVSEDEKKEVDLMFIEELQKRASVEYNGEYWNILPREVLKHFKFKFIKILNHNFMINWFKYFDLKNRQFLSLKCFNTLRPKYFPWGKLFMCYLYTNDDEIMV